MIHILATVLLIVGLVSIWFDDPIRLTSALGLIGAGLAVALQKVVTAMAAYLLILRGRTFRVGDRIMMGGVRGDVIDLGFLQTTIMEMGEPPAMQAADPAIWVRSRQYTGRLVMVTNDKLFDEPVYNYSREFPFIWEEMTTPIRYTGNWRRAEQILLEVVDRHTVRIAELSQADAKELQRRYFVQVDELRPRVFLRLTDNWIELTARFICRTHDVRAERPDLARHPPRVQRGRNRNRLVHVRHRRHAAARVAYAQQRGAAGEDRANRLSRSTEFRTRLERCQRRSPP